MVARIAVVTVALAVGPGAQSARQVLDTAMADFRAGRIEPAVAGFDRVVALDPASMPYLWQRGIALFYAGRYDDCRRQFESHRLVNPADVENAAWHFLCVTRAKSAAAAREVLLPVGADPRVPLPTIYAMFEGRASAAEVIAAAGGQASAEFYAHLYVGLYLDVTGETDRALEHLKTAASDRFASVGGYMHDVARVHLTRRRDR